MKVAGIFQYFDCKTSEFQYLEKYDDLYIGDIIIFQDIEHKEEAGEITYFHRNAKDEHAVIINQTILRKATEHDLQKIEANKERGKSAMEICKKKILQHGLDMHLMETMYSFDGTKINFIFTAADRVDFRELVKDLAKTFQKQIHLQQIGPRDKAKIVSGFGRCGQQTCCSRFLPKLESITMDMVRVQNLSNKGSDKLSGLCGKLLCCLKYEVKQYAEAKKKMPDSGDIVTLKTKEEGRIISTDILNHKMKVLLSDDNVKIFGVEDIVSIKKQPLEKFSRNSEAAADFKAAETAPAA